MQSKKITLTLDMEITLKTKMVETKWINDVLVIGDLVISTDGDSYRYLIGRVTAIHLLGSAEHETSNSMDDIYVDLSKADYSPTRIKEIEVMFSDLYNNSRPFDELPLDEVIMEPSTLVHISNIADAELKFILESEANSKDYIKKILDKRKTSNKEEME